MKRSPTYRADFSALDFALKITMKTVGLFLMLLLSNTVHSMGFGGATGEDRDGQIIHIEESSTNGISIFVEKKQSQEPWEEYSLASDCPGWDWGTSPKTLVCKSDGKSPLAGASYNIGRSKKIKNTCGRAAKIYTCVKGCESKRVPLFLVEQPWEC